MAAGRGDAAPRLAIGWRYSAPPCSACYEPERALLVLAYVRPPLVERAPAGRACCVARAFSRLPRHPGRSVSASFACLRPLTYWLPASLRSWPESLDTAAYLDGSRLNCALDASGPPHPPGWPGWLRPPSWRAGSVDAPAGWLAPVVLPPGPPSGPLSSIPLSGVKCPCRSGT